MSIEQRTILIILDLLLESFKRIEQLENALSKSELKSIDKRLNKMDEDIKTLYHKI